jgi:cytochrome c5
MLNTGHDYRLVHLLGWDLRGREGIAGPDYQKDPHVLLPNLLDNVDSRDVWIARLTRGEDAIPAYGSVLSASQIEALVDFLLAVRGGKLPQAADVFALSRGTPESYTLVPGGDAARGAELFAHKCEQCHGADGTATPIEEGAHTVGTYVRQHAYETWLKVLNGHPDSTMDAQLAHDLGREQLGRALRDLNAALCDRTRYPRGNATAADVPNGDPRCGAYLK